MSWERPFKMSTRVLVTGLQGFTGQYVLSELQAQGLDVVGLSLNDQPIDLNDANAVSSAITLLQPEYVIHLAAIAFVGHSDVAAMYQTNIVGTRNLLQALAHQVSPVRHIIVVSSANVYGIQPEGLINESALCCPANDYAVSKFAMEQMVQLWRSTLPITVVRPFNYVGAGQSEQFVIPKIVSAFAQRNHRISLGNIAVWREYNDVRWLAAVYAQLLFKPPQPSPINIATGTLHSLQEVIDTLSELTEHKPVVVQDPNLMRANEIKRLGGDITKLLSLELQGSPYSLRQTLSWMLACASS